MIIAYIVSNINTASKGNGGHYYSMLTTANTLQKDNEVLVINIGTAESVALEKTNLRVVNILSSKLNTYHLLKKLNNFLKKNPVDVMHCFDVLAFFYCRVVCTIRKVPVMLTKCGGVNPKYFPHCQSLVTFSLENTRYFQSSKKFRNTQIKLIPNRVNSFGNNEKRIASLKEKHNLDQYDFIFLRISRIGKQYEKSAKQLINFVAALEPKGTKICLLFIGTLVDVNIYEDLKKFKPEVNIIIETDDYFTQNAKELIKVADVVLGTGRSFMEAALKKKIMLAPLHNELFPVLVTEENFTDLLSTNFSERGNIRDFHPEDQFDFIRKILKNNKERNFFFFFMNSLYQDNFNIESKRSTYQSLYNGLEYNTSPKIIDIFLNYLFVQRRYNSSKS